MSYNQIAIVQGCTIIRTKLNILKIFKLQKLINLTSKGILRKDFIINFRPTCFKPDIA